MAHSIIFGGTILITLIPKIRQQMKKSLLLLFAAALTSVSVSSQVTGIAIEPIFVHDGSISGVPAGLTTYRIYAECTNPGDIIMSVAGYDIAPLSLNVPDGIWNAAEPSSSIGPENNCNLYAAIPSLEYDSYVTIGRSCNTDPGVSVFASQDNNNPWIPSFDTAPYGSGNILLNTTVGGAWSSLPTTGGVPNENVLAGDDLRVLIAQITTSGSICGSFNVQCRLEGETSGGILYTSLAFGTDGCGDPGCTDDTALNYNPSAGFNDGTCLYPCALEFSEINTVNPTCFGDANGSISAVITGFQDVLEIEFNGGNPAANTGNFSATGLEEGIYSILARDRKFYNEIFNPGGIYGICEVEEFVDLYTMPLLIEAPSITNITCGGDNDGCALSLFQGGIGTPTFAVYQANGTLVEADLPSPEYCGFEGGSYYFTGADENGCTAQSGNFSIVSPPQLILFLGATLPATCFNSADGQQVFTWSGGTGDVDWSMEDDGEYEMEGNPSNLVLTEVTPGEYTMYAADVNGCTASIDYVVTGGPQINIEAAITSPSCPSNADGSFVVTATGGTGVIAYDLGCTGEYSTENTMIDLAAGVYTVCVQDAAGCNAAADIVVEDPAELSVDFDVTQISCFESADGVIIVNASGGAGDYDYSLDGETYTDSNIFENLEAGTYDMYVTDANGCLIQVIQSLVIVEPTPVTVIVDEVGGDGGNGTGFISVSADGGTAPYSFSWTGPDGYTSIDEDIIDLLTGEYVVTVTDENGCQSAETASGEITGVAELSNGVVIAINPNPTNAEFRLNIVGLAGDKLAYSVMDTQGRKVFSKELGNANGSRSEQVDVRALAAGVYYVNVQVGNENTTLKLIKQ